MEIRVEERMNEGKNDDRVIIEKEQRKRNGEVKFRRGKKSEREEVLRKILNNGRRYRVWK